MCGDLVLGVVNKGFNPTTLEVKSGEICEYEDSFVFIVSSRLTRAQYTDIYKLYVFFEQVLS